MAVGTAPFFLSLHYTAPNWPWETRDDAALADEVRGNLFHLHGGNIHTCRRMIHHLDEGIGWVMMDWSATALAAAGVPADPACPLDGVSLLPVLHDAGDSRRGRGQPGVFGEGHASAVRPRRVTGLLSGASAIARP